MSYLINNKILTLLTGRQSGPSISNYMAQMDRELASTSLGSSFIKKTTTDKDKPKVYKNSIKFYYQVFNF